MSRLETPLTRRYWREIGVLLPMSAISHLKLLIALTCGFQKIL